LPILPEMWQYLVSASTKKQFGILQKLMHRPDVDSVICATDAGVVRLGALKEKKRPHHVEKQLTNNSC